MRQSKVVLGELKFWSLKNGVNTYRKEFIIYRISVETKASRCASNDACGAWASRQLAERSAEFPLKLSL
jgi:hypothetical protein